MMCHKNRKIWQLQDVIRLYREYQDHIEATMEALKRQYDLFDDKLKLLREDLAYHQAQSRQIKAQIQGILIDKHDMNVWEARNGTVSQKAIDTCQTGQTGGEQVEAPRPHPTSESETETVRQDKGG